MQLKYKKYMTTATVANYPNQLIIFDSISVVDSFRITKN